MKRAASLWVAVVGLLFLTSGVASAASYTYVGNSHNKIVERIGISKAHSIHLGV